MHWCDYLLYYYTHLYALMRLLVILLHPLVCIDAITCYTITPTCMHWCDYLLYYYTRLVCIACDYLLYYYTHLYALMRLLVILLHPLVCIDAITCYTITPTCMHWCDYLLYYYTHLYALMRLLVIHLWLPNISIRFSCHFLATNKCIKWSAAMQNKRQFVHTDILILEQSTQKLV